MDKVTTGINNMDRSLPLRIELQNYPNPFNSSINIAFSIFNRERVIVNIYDLNGRMVRKLINKKFNTGRHIVTWNGCNEETRHISSGIYLLNFKVGNYEQTKLIILSK